jgi:hypothetical protein
VKTGPTVYRVMRGTLESVFGAELVRKLDRLEARLVQRRLPLLASG